MARKKGGDALDSGRVTGGGDIIAILSARVSELSKRVALLSAELDAAQKRVAIYEEHDATIQEAVSGALRAAYTIRERAETTAEQILEQAREERRLILAEIERLQDERDRVQDDIAAQRRSGLAALGSMPLSSEAAMEELRSVANEALRGIFKEIVADVRAKPAETEETPRATSTSSLIEEEDVMAPPAARAPDRSTVEADRAATERANAERDAAAARAEEDRSAAQRATEERAAADARAAGDRAAAIRATEERAAAEARAAEERAAAQRASEERAAAEARADAERAAADRAAQERTAAEARAAAEQSALERAVAEGKAASERAAAERAVQERAAQERAAQERAAQERAFAERAAMDRTAQERASAERAVAERAAAERAAAERAVAERAAAERAAAERAAQQRAVAERDAQAQLPAPRPPLEVVRPTQEGRDIAPLRVEAATPASDIQLVLSPVPSFPRLVEIERQIQALPNVRTLYVRDFRGGAATLAVQLRSPITPEEFATLLSGLREPHLRLVAGSRNTLELRVEGEAGVA